MMTYAEIYKKLKLLEQTYASQILLEYNRGVLIDTFDRKYEAAARADRTNPHATLDDFLNDLERKSRQDGSFQFLNPYIKWIVQRYVSNLLGTYEDLWTKAVPALLLLDKLKKSKRIRPEHADVNRFKTIDELVEASRSYDEGSASKRQEEKNVMKQEVDVLLDTPEFLLAVPLTERASQQLGRHTKWCTSAKENCLFRSYHKAGPLYVVLMKSRNERFQIHLPLAEIKNSEDEPLTERMLDAHKAVFEKVFEKILERVPLNKFALLLYEYPFLFKLDVFHSHPELEKYAEDHYVALEYISNPSAKLIRNVVKNHPNELQHVKKPSEDLVLTALKKNGNTIRFVENPTHEMMKIAVTSPPLDGMAIGFIKDPPDDILRLAVKASGRALANIKNPSRELQELSVETHPWSIQFIKDPPYDLMKFVVDFDPKLIRYINDPPEDLMFLAIERNPESIRFIRNPTERVQLAVASEDPDMMDLLRNRTPLVQLLYDIHFGIKSPKNITEAEKEKIRKVSKNFPNILRIVRKAGVDI
jgi:hypothetical protein